MINDLKAVFNHAFQEFEIEGKQNPFAKLELPAPTVASIDARDPLPDDLIRKVYEELDVGSVFYDVWTTSHHTGAIASEILGLKAKDVNETEAGLAMTIEPNEVRGVKKIVRERTIPLIGLAASALNTRASGLKDEELLFPQYATPRGHSNFSQSMMNRIRKHRADDKHVFYSLRHNMKDSLIGVNALPRQQFAILGHTFGSSVSEGYGSRPDLEDLRAVLSRIDFASLYSLHHS